MRALRRRYGRTRTPAEEVERWSANARAWWSRAEHYPKELRAYRNAKTAKTKRAALEKLKEALR